MAVKILLSFRCTPEIKKAIKHRAEKLGVSPSMFLSMLLETPGVLSLVDKAHKKENRQNEHHKATG